MTAGFPAGATDINNRAGNCAYTLREALRSVQLFKAFLDTQTDANLTALGIAQTDVNTMRSAYVDLDKLRTIYEGTATQASAYDFRTFAKLLTGPQ